jgi:hypothetical protein
MTFPCPLCRKQTSYNDAKDHHIESEHICSICLDNINNPAILPCGHIFCDYCIKQYNNHINNDKDDSNNPINSSINDQINDNNYIYINSLYNNRFLSINIHNIE